MLNLGFSAIFSLFVTISFFVFTTELVGLVSSLAFTVLISATVFFGSFIFNILVSIYTIKIKNIEKIIFRIICNWNISIRC